jgi:hypothetical protein
MTTTNRVQGIEAASGATMARAQRLGIQPIPTQKASRFVPGRQSAKREGQRELFLAHPAAFADDLLMDDGGSSAAAAEREICVADKDVCDLRKGRPLAGGLTADVAAMPQLLRKAGQDAGPFGMPTEVVPRTIL